MFDQCLYFNTTALARRLEREWSGAFQPFGLTPPQAFMLRAILNRPGLLQSELSAELAIARPTATRALDFLEHKHYIERRPTAGDGREISVWPTSTATLIRTALNDASGAITARLKKALGSGEFADTVTRIRSTRTTLE
jgi:MarR family transcriptional regulator, temperature-dependent positive regulator of motility